MSLVDVEKIMDETQEAVEYQRVCPCHTMNLTKHIDGFGPNIFSVCGDACSDLHRKLMSSWGRT